MMNNLYIIVFFSSFLISFCVSDPMTFTWTKNNGEQIVGGYTDFLKLYSDHEEDIQKASGYWTLRDKTTDLMAEKKMAMESNGEPTDKSNRAVSDIFWGFMEEQFKLIGMDLKIENGRVSSW